MPVRMIEIQERGKRIFKRTDLIDTAGRSLMLSETRRLMAVEVKDTADGTEVMALGFIGQLPLTSNITLNIIPKFPIGNFWAMLEIGGENYRNILSTVRRYQTSENRTPIQLLARSFCYYLKGAISAGLERSYYHNIRTSYFKPRVEFGHTINRFISRGNPVETVSRVIEFGLDSSVNQVVKAACIRFAQLVPRTEEWKEERVFLRLALDTLQRVSKREPGELDFDLDKSVSPRVQHLYSGMLSTYQLLLTGGGIAFTFESGGRQLPSFLFKLEEIFERFVRETLTKGLCNSEVSVLDGNKHHGYLFVDSKVYRTKTDLIFRRKSKEVIALGEVKYKPRLKEADRYQIISHVTAAKASIGILFTPANDQHSQQLELIGRLATGAKIYNYQIDIRGEIDASQTRLVEDVLAVLRTD